MDDRPNIAALVGFYLWRSGAVVVAAYLAWQGGSWMWDVLRTACLPRALLLGVFLLGAGFVLFIGSFILERMVDAKAERGLRDP